MTTFPTTPATLNLSVRGGTETWIGNRIFFEDNAAGPESPPKVLVLQGMNDERSWPVEELEQVSHEEWKGLLWNETGEDYVPFHIRATLPRDAEASVTMEGFPLNIPLPVELIGHIHASGDFAMPELFAMTDDDGFVATMMLSAPTGLYVRYASMWHDLTDPDVVDGLNVHEVAPAALELYDARERQGQLPNVSSMLSLEGGDLGITVDQIGGDATEIPGASEEIVTASGATVTVPTLRGPDDVPAAVAAAADNPEIQWWVERRLRVLGIETDLPWS